VRVPLNARRTAEVRAVCERCGDQSAPEISEGDGAGHVSQSIGLSRATSTSTSCQSSGSNLPSSAANLNDVLKRLAEEDSRSLSSMIEIALRDYVERHGGKQPSKRK
jgi:hypothetical protein